MKTSEDVAFIGLNEDEQVTLPLANSLVVLAGVPIIAGSIYQLSFSAFYDLVFEKNLALFFERLIG